MHGCPGEERGAAGTSPSTRFQHSCDTASLERSQCGVQGWPGCSAPRGSLRLCLPSPVYYEGLQDKLAQIRDARGALNALREEHREKLRRAAEEAERQRQIQLAQKLEIMRQKKQVRQGSVPRVCRAVSASRPACALGRLPWQEGMLQCPGF